MDINKVLDILYVAYKDAQEKDFDAGFNFNLDKYEWELGAEIACILRDSYCIYDYNESFDIVYKCMGIDTRINYNNPKIIRLWKKQFEVVL